jgi:hypothetical protein
VTRWIRTRPDREHDVLAGLVAAAAGAVLSVAVFYVTRLALAREPVTGPDTGVERRGSPTGVPDREG